MCVYITNYNYNSWFIYTYYAHATAHNLYIKHYEFMKYKYANSTNNTLHILKY